MKIKMLKSQPGAINNGLNVKVYEKEKVYNTEDMEGVGEIFLKLGIAKEYIVPQEIAKQVRRHEAKMQGNAPENKAVIPDSNKKVMMDDLKGLKAGQIRALAAKKKIDLTDVSGNTSAPKLAEILLERQDD